MEKEVFSHCESWMVTPLSFPEKHTGSFFSSLQQIWSSFWIFWKQQAACQFLLGNHFMVHFHLIRVTTDMVNSIHWTLSWYLFLWKCTVCPRCVFTQLWNSQETCFCESGNWGLMAKEVISPQLMLDICTLKSEVGHLVVSDSLWIHWL